MERDKMESSRWLLLVNVAAGCYMMGQIWLVQMSCYPLWRFVGPAEFHAYHVAWWHSIWGVVFPPAGVALLCAIALVKRRPPGVAHGAVWLGACLEVLVCLLTAVWWGPLMARLEAVSGPVYGALYEQLMTTHWLRVAIITAYGALAVWMVARYSDQERGQCRG